MDTTNLTIGWIGAGVMGAPMAGHLLDAGHTLRIHTRTRSKAEKLLERGASWAASPADAADGADMVISIVGYPQDVEATHLGSSGTLRATALPRYLIDMTTSRPSLAVKIAREARTKGVGAMDAPVSGGDVGARNGTLSIMVGADERDFEHVRPVFECLGSTIVRQGGPGAGQHTKMVNQILIASTMMGACEGLLYAKRSGLEPTSVLDSVSKGAAGSWTIDNLVPRMIKGDFDPGFFVDHFIKDLGIALEEASRMKLALPGLALARQLYLGATGHNLGRKGTQALYLMLEQLSGVDEHARGTPKEGS